MGKKDKWKDKLKNRLKEKKGIIQDYLGWTLLAVALLILIGAAIVILTGKGTNALNYIKNLLRFGK